MKFSTIYASYLKFTMDFYNVNRISGLSYIFHKKYWSRNRRLLKCNEFTVKGLQIDIFLFKM